ncbi:hypothetical protein [Chloroflexus aurantiacus]|uniref:hypothetical protein n=1 Tax=Chloroflexus aurantiacus TaxID=1108 RepID=UPI00005BAB4C|nr:hypothetical protein [Chloroflexus aurantiacus]
MNNPVKNTDPTGHWIESAIDIAFIAYDLYDISQNGLTWTSGLALAADVASLALPMVAGGGMLIRAAAHADDAAGALHAMARADEAAGAAQAAIRGGEAGAGQISESAREASIVYRGLAQGEDPTKGIVARAPGLRNVDPKSHVAGLRASPWISTTKDKRIAIEKYGRYGVVQIDLTKVRSEIVDISNGIPGVKGRLSQWAKHDKEVLIRDFIPPEAIIRIQ